MGDKVRENLSSHQKVPRRLDPFLLEIYLVISTCGCVKFFGKVQLFGRILYNGDCAASALCEEILKIDINRNGGVGSISP